MKSVKRKSKVKNFYFFIIVFSFSFFIFNLSAARAAEIGLGVTKDTFDLEILPGDSYEGNLTVFNRSKEVPLPFHIELALWNLKEDSEDIEFVKAESALNAAKWFDFKQGKDFILDVARSRRVDFMIEPPEDVAPGAHFVMMRLQAVLPEHYFEDQGLASGGPRLIPEVGVLFFIKISPFTLEGEQGLYAAQILSFETEGASPLPLLGKIIPQARASVFEDMVKSFAAKIRNTGLYHFKASGYVEMKNIFGITVARADVPGRYLLPNRNRAFAIPVIKEGESFLKNLSYVGPYSARMALNIPGQAEPLEMEERFWVFPWKMLGSVLLTITILFFLRKRIQAAVKALLAGSR